jgi:hypothetical protein
VRCGGPPSFSRREGFAPGGAGNSSTLTEVTGRCPGSKVKTTITRPDGKTTTVVVRRSGCGCLTALALVVVVFGPAAWFGVVGATIAYSVLAFVAVIVGAGWLLEKRRWPFPTTPTPQPPPVPWPPQTPAPPPL